MHLKPSYLLVDTSILFADPCLHLYIIHMVYTWTEGLNECSEPPFHYHTALLCYCTVLIIRCSRKLR